MFGYINKLKPKHVEMALFENIFFEKPPNSS